MTCPGGCIGGGGQPRITSDAVREARIRAIYAEDEGRELRKSHENPDVQALYEEFLGEPLGHKSHELLAHQVHRERQGLTSQNGSRPRLQPPTGTQRPILGQRSQCRGAFENEVPTERATIVTKPCQVRADLDRRRRLRLSRDQPHDPREGGLPRGHGRRTQAGPRAHGAGEARPGHHRPDDDQPRLRLLLRPHHQRRSALRGHPRHHRHLGLQRPGPRLQAPHRRRPRPHARGRLLRQAARPHAAARHDRRAARATCGGCRRSAGAARPPRRDAQGPPMPTPRTPPRRTDAHLGQPAHHHRHRQVPHVLCLRAGVSGQGHPGGRRPGEVIQPRCIGCGNCLRVCSQNAKQVRDDTERTFALLESAAQVAAMVAPSFPAEFVDIQPGHPGGHDPGARASTRCTRSRWEPTWSRRPTAAATRRIPTSATSPPPARRWCRTCASTIPRLMPNLAPMVSPMVAMARVLRHELGDDLKVGLHRPLRGQEAGLRRLHPPRVRSGAHLRRVARHVRAARHQARGLRRPTTTSTRPTAGWAWSSPSRAACCRRPSSRKTC